MPNKCSEIQNLQWRELIKAADKSLILESSFESLTFQIESRVTIDNFESSLELTALIVV